MTFGSNTGSRTWPDSRFTIVVIYLRPIRSTCLDIIISVVCRIRPCAWKRFGDVEAAGRVQDRLRRKTGWCAHHVNETNVKGWLWQGDS